METNANFSLVGWIVGILMLTTIAFAMWLIDPRPNQETYQIKFDRSVEGLQSGSTVTLSGVPVGQVTSVRLAENEPENVVVVLTLDPSAAKVHGLEATISTDLITGEAALVLEGRRGRQGIYTDKSGKKIIPAADETGLLGRDATATVETVANSIRALNEGLEPEKQRVITSDLVRLRVTTAALASDAEGWDERLASTKGRLLDLGQRVGGWGNNLRDADRRISGRSASAIAQLRLRQFREGVQNAENKLSQIRSGIPAVEDSLVEGETDLRELSRELAPLSEKIEDIQVEGITSNPPLPDYRPKRREAGTNIDDLK